MFDAVDLVALQKCCWDGCLHRQAHNMHAQLIRFLCTYIYICVLLWILKMLEDISTRRVHDIVKGCCADSLCCITCRCKGC